MLVLNEKDMKRTVSYEQVMDKVDHAFRIVHSGHFYMPERPVVTHGKDTLLYMPCFLPEGFGTKFLTVFPENPGKGLPYIDGIMLLNDSQSGKTIAIMDAKCLTGMRTGAAGGVGIRNFSRADCKTAGIIGAGQQGFYQAIYASVVRDIKDIYFYDIAPKDWDSYIEGLERALGRKAPGFHVCRTVEELLGKSEIVITATPAADPVMPDDADLLRGKCFIAIGSYKPQMRELPDAIWDLTEYVYTELPFAIDESGDLSQPLARGILHKERVILIGEWLTREHKTLPAPGQTTFFKSVGMGLLDVCVGRLIYERALELGIGQEVDI